MTLVLAAVLAVSGLIVSRYVDRSERDALDDRLRRTVELSRETALAAVERELPDNDRRLDNVLSATGTSLRLLLDRTVLLDTGRPPPSRPALADGLRTFSAGGEQYRSYTATLRSPELGGLARLEATTRLDALENRQSALRQTLAALGAGALLVAALGVWFAADLVLRPLRRLRALASSIAGDEDLDRRVPPDDGPGELRSLAASFNDMLARLGRSAADRERAMAATRRFTADAGHELRTPLTSVQATLSALSRHPGISEEQRRALVGDALAEHGRLVDLLDGLQALARGDAAPIELTETDLSAVVLTALDDVASRHPHVDWSRDLPDDLVPVSGWEPGLRLLVDNLLQNAARHGRAGGTVRVTLVPPRAGAGPELHVDDDGPGIPEEARERIFEPFARLNGGATAPGSGLGLALVAQQVRAHGAAVEVSRGPLGGARLTVRFPAAAAGQPSARSSAGDSTAFSAESSPG